MIQKQIPWIVILSVLIGMGGGCPVARATDPNLVDGTVGDHLQAAQSYMKASQWDYASYEWRNVLAQDPKNLQANLGLAEALRQTGFLQDAIHQLEQARQVIPANSQQGTLELVLASDYLQAGDLQKARQLYDGILAREPYNSSAFRGLMGLRAKLPPNQRGDLDKILAQKNNQSKVLWKKAMKSAQYLDAARYMEIMAVYTPTPKVLNDYGISLLMAGKSPVAAQIFQNLKVKDSSWRTYANSAIVSLSLGNPYQAQQEMERAIANITEAPIRARLYNDLGYIYENGKKSTKARFAYERATELDPNFTKAKLNLGYIYQKDRDFEAAVSLYKALTQKEPQNTQAWNQLGFSYELQHKPKQAISSYKEAIRLDPKYKDAYYNLGTLYRKLDKVELASEAFKKMTDIEFTEIENMKKANGTPTAGQSELFKFIDLFLTERL